MSHRLFYGTLVFLLIFQACKSTQPIRPKEYYNKMESETPPSTLNLPILISKSEMEKNINNQMGEVLFEDNDMRGDGLKIKATKQDKITLEVAGQQVKYQVPIDLWVQKDLGITTVEGEGALMLEFTTDFNIQPDWDFQTTTLLANYNWTKAPIVKTPFGSLNVTGIADQFIDQVKGQITSSIDQQLRDLLDLKTEVGKAWQQLQKPFLLSAENRTYLLMNPTSVGMTPLQSSSEKIEATVVISALPKLFFGESPTSNSTGQLPDFQMIESVSKEGFEINLGSSISFPEAERIAKQNMVGEVYDYGKRSVKVEDVELYGQGNKLVVKTNLSGSYKGDVYLIGKPEYNARKNKIELSDVEFDFSSKKSLMRTATWLFKGSFKRKIQDELDFHLTQNIDETRAVLQKELKQFQLAPGIELTGELANLNVSEVYIGADAIHVKIGLDGKLKLEIETLEIKN